MKTQLAQRLKAARMAISPDITQRDLAKRMVLAMAAKNSEPVLRKYVKEGGTELFVADDMRYPSYRLDEGAKIIGRVMEVTIRKILN